MHSPKLHFLVYHLYTTLAVLHVDRYFDLYNCFYKLNYRKRFPYHLMYKQKTCFYNKTLLSFSPIFSTYMKGFF